MEVRPAQTGKTRALRGKREETKQQNRTVILEAARRVFAEMGFASATVRDIIRATPLASGTFYNYFKSKEEVFQALHDETALKLRPLLREERARAETLEQFVSGTFRTIFEFAAAERETIFGPRDAQHMQVRMDTPEVVAGFEELREDIERAIARGLFPAVDSNFLTAAMVGVAREVAQEMIKRDPPDTNAASDFATALFLQGLRGLPGKQPAQRETR
ncbi:MAG: TetR/AcrR family transcriptional regulator [Alphaproteobacteria bacterium]